MDIRQLSKKFRQIADALDELFEIPGTPAIAERILKKTTLKGYKYKGNHWTQKPGGKEKMIAAAKLGVRRKRAKAKKV